MKSIRIVRGTHGARLVQGDTTLSHVRDRPGPTHGLFDVLAACVKALSPGPRFLMLGFAAGGVVAPLRAMGWTTPIEAVELSPVGERLFRELCDDWAGDVTVHRGDAVAWLQRSRRRFDLVLEDLSVAGSAGARKPEVSLQVLPALMRERLRQDGVVVMNLLPVPGVPWTRLLPDLAAPHRGARVVHLRDYDNRLLIAGDDLPSAAAISRSLRDTLQGIGSRAGDGLSVARL